MGKVSVLTPQTTATQVAKMSVNHISLSEDNILTATTISIHNVFAHGFKPFTLMAIVMNGSLKKHIPML